MKREPNLVWRMHSGTKAMRNIGAMFLEMRKYTRPKRRVYGWPRTISTAELAERGRQL